MSEREREIWDDPESEEHMMERKRMVFICYKCDEVGCDLTAPFKPKVCIRDGEPCVWERVYSPEEFDDAADDGDPGEYVEWRDFDPDC